MTRLPYLVPSLPIDDRVSDLLARMTLEEKAGQMFHAMVVIGPDGTLTGALDFLGVQAPQDMVQHREMTHFNLVGSSSTREMAEWHNRLQDLSLSTRLQIPITLATDPRHSFTTNPGTGSVTGAFSSWPEPTGLAAIGDPDLVERCADICRQEYLAVGFRVALHPQIDVATEARWARVAGTFGEDAGLTSRLVAAYIRGFRGDALGPESVATMVKHFPGGAPVKDGEDPHFEYGRQQIYPGGNFDYHLEPFRAALAAGATQVMPSYGMPVGTEFEEVGFGLNQGVIGGLLRERLGFDGIVCTDWGLLTDAVLFGQPMPARAWGAEHLTPQERARKAIEAGVDQFGGEACPELVVELVRSGEVPESRIDVSVRRLLREKFSLGLFERRHVDVDAAERLVGNVTFRAEGFAAQARSITVLTNNATGAEPTLPLVEGCRIYVEGVDPEVANRYATVVNSQSDADVSILRLAAPFEPRTGGFEAMFHAGSLDFPPDDLAAVLDRLRAGPTVVDVLLDRPAMLEAIAEHAAALVANFGASDEALLDVLFGRTAAGGRLPFDLPRSMAAVRASRSDTPFDTEDPIFRFGHGLDLP